MVSCGARAQDAPVLLATVGCLGVGLPEVIVGREEVDVDGDRGLDAVDRIHLVLRARAGTAVAAALARPARLGDDDPLTATGSADLFDGLLHPRAGALGNGCGVEECVGVGCGVVGVLAKLRVGDKSVEGVDSNNVALEGS